MLYTHGEKTITDREALREFPVPTLDQLREKRGPEAGTRWQPQQFHDVADTIAKVAEGAGLRIASEHYNVSKDRFDVFGCVQFEGTVQGRKDMAPVLGWRMSNMQRFKLLGVSGSRVFVCNNGAIVGDFCFGHKMTNGMEREETIEEGLHKWKLQQARLAAVYDLMERVELPQQAQVDNVLMEGVRRNVIAPSQLRKIDTEFNGDRSKEQFGERPTVRRLYEAVTEVGKTWSSPRVVEKGLRGFPDMALRLYGEAELATTLAQGGADDFDPSRN